MNVNAKNGIGTTLAINIQNSYRAVRIVVIGLVCFFLYDILSFATKVYVQQFELPALMQLDGAILKENFTDTIPEPVPDNFALAVRQTSQDSEFFELYYLDKSVGTYTTNIATGELTSFKLENGNMPAIMTLLVFCCVMLVAVLLLYADTGMVNISEIRFTHISSVTREVLFYAVIIIVALAEFR